MVMKLKRSYKLKILYFMVYTYIAKQHDISVDHLSFLYIGIQIFSLSRALLYYKDNMCKMQATRPECNYDATSLFSDRRKTVYVHSIFNRPKCRFIQIATQQLNNVVQTARLINLSFDVCSHVNVTENTMKLPLRAVLVSSYN